ncbi:Xanthine/uracil permease family protein isoform 1 [Hibiscus syriacus]|uniref:Xanthine/uracil permease family protein isoform 1 n=1 Tax=Hibiscus syriacus TaxID=106335 RepID=A0A6A2Y2S9_HIBSY|nr:Xanthine/uracil permease family protein isoform 1 [Hibiscus syriacus]
MAFTDLFAGEIATELLKQLIVISRKSCLCKSSADSLITSIEELLPIINEIKYSGVELSAIRQSQLDLFSETLRGGIELSRKVLASGRWNVYKNLQLARKMEKLEKQISRLLQRQNFFLTVSQSPDIQQLRTRIWGFLTGNEAMGYTNSLFVPHGKLQCEWGSGPRTLVVLDDVWSLPILEQLIFRIPTYKTLVVSRFRFSTTVVHEVYKVELLKMDTSFLNGDGDQYPVRTRPLPSLPTANETLVKQIVNECKGLPLALKVIGASLRDQHEMYWASAKKRLLRGEPICESHENKLLERMAISVEYLNKRLRTIHDIDEEEAFAILVELADKNLITLVKDARVGDAYTSFYEISVTQHDVLRDLALHLSNRADVNERKRLLMPRRDTELPREWERNTDQPFNAQIVSVHTGIMITCLIALLYIRVFDYLHLNPELTWKMREMDWFRMEFPKAEVLMLNFSSSEYFLPPFIDSMPKLKALIVINYGTTAAILKNFSAFTTLAYLRSLWLEKVARPAADLPSSDLIIDHCDDLMKLPLSICVVNSLKSLSITNCHRLCELLADLGMLKKLQILRLYACPELKVLPPSIGELIGLKYLDISQCVNLRCLPREIGKLASLEKIDMRECSQIMSLPPGTALSNLKSLRRVTCDDEVLWQLKYLEKAMPELYVQVAEKWYSLDWLDG